MITTQEIVVEPLKYFEVVKDLIVDLKPFYERIKSINPQPQTTQIAAERYPERERPQSIEERSRFDDALKCILCGCCYGACPVMVEQDHEFIGPAAILRAQRYIFDSRTADVAERLAGDAEAAWRLGLQKLLHVHGCLSKEH